MQPEVKLLLLGFLPFEKETFESFFKLVGRRDTLYKMVGDVAEARVVLVNSDNPTAVQWANASVSPPQKALFIGAADPLNKWPAAPKPVKLTTVLGLLDLLTMADRRVSEQPALSRGEASVMTAPAPAAPHRRLTPKNRSAKALSARAQAAKATATLAHPVSWG
jgi:hypothetical protein